MGPGGPGHRDGRRLLGRPVAALGPGSLAHAHLPAALGPAGDRAGRHPADPGLARRRAPVGTGIGEGRWSLLPVGEDEHREPEAPDGLTMPANEELAEAVAWQLLARWGVVAWEVWGRESFRVPWREVVWALRRLEARGVALGGRFVVGLSGEQYALPEAAEELAEGASPRPERRTAE